MGTPPKDPLKAEIRAMGKLATIFEVLTPEARQRALTWLSAVYGVQPPLLTIQHVLDLARELRGSAPQAPVTKLAEPLPVVTAVAQPSPGVEARGDYRDRRARTPVQKM